MRRQLESLGGKLGNLANVGMFIISLITLIGSAIGGAAAYCVHNEQRMTRIETRLDAIVQTLEEQRSGEQQSLSTLQHEVDTQAATLQNHEGRIETLEHADIERR